MRNLLQAPRPSLQSRRACARLRAVSHTEHWSMPACHLPLKSCHGERGRIVDSKNPRGNAIGESRYARRPKETTEEAVPRPPRRRSVRCRNQTVRRTTAPVDPAHRRAQADTASPASSSQAEIRHDDRTARKASRPGNRSAASRSRHARRLLSQHLRRRRTPPRGRGSASAWRTCNAGTIPDSPRLPRKIEGPPAVPPGGQGGSTRSCRTTLRDARLVRRGGGGQLPMGRVASPLFVVLLRASSLRHGDLCVHSCPVKRHAIVFRMQKRIR